MGSKSRMRGRRRCTSAPLRLARGSSAAIQPLPPVAATPLLEPSDAVPLRTEADALTTWNAMCRVEQMLRERRGS